MSLFTVAFKPGWIHTKDSLIYSNNFTSIINFYLFSTPCPNLSSSGQTMIDREWSKDVWKTPYLREYLLKIANLNDSTYKKVTVLKEMSNGAATIKLNGTFQKKRDANRIVFYNGNKDSEFLNIFFYIRCAIAHGRFEIHTDEDGNSIYMLEAVKKINKTDDYEVRARMILRESTLVEWATIIKNGQKSFEEIKQCVTKEIQIQIINAIQSHPKITKRTLTDSLPFEKNEILTQTKILSTTKQIQYDKKKKTWVMCSDSAYNNL